MLHKCFRLFLQGCNTLYKFIVRLAGDNALLVGGEDSRRVVYSTNRHDVFNVHGNGSLSVHM